MPCINPILSSAFPQACDFVLSNISFHRALDGATPPVRSSTCFINGEQNESPGGRNLVLLAKERGVDLPVQQWERDKLTFNAIQISLLLALGVALWPISTATVGIFALFAIVPPRIGTLPIVGFAEPILSSCDRKLTDLRNEFGGLITGLLTAQASAGTQGEMARLKRKKVARSVRDAEDKIRKKWHEMDQPLKDMKRVLDRCAVIKHYFNGWIVRVVEALPIAATTWVISRIAPPGWEDYAKIERIFDRYRKKYEAHLNAWCTVATILRLTPKSF